MSGRRVATMCPKKRILKEIEIKEWYDRWHSVRGRDAWRPYEAYLIFLDYLSVERRKKILDVGCGTGYFLKAANRNGLVAYGVDVSKEGIKIAKTVSPSSFISISKGESLNFVDNTFDYVACLGSLEHFSDINKGLNEIKRVAKENAIFCIMVPNVNYIFWKISGQLGTEQQNVSETLLSLKQWKNIFDKEGFKILKIYQDKWFMKTINIFSSTDPIETLKRVARKLIWAFLPLNYAYQFIFILEKKQKK
jgi:SAM-dependent methyltransferase